MKSLLIKIGVGVSLGVNLFIFSALLYNLKMYDKRVNENRKFIKDTIIDVCAMTSFVIVVMLGASALNVYFTRESRIKENRDWMQSVIEKEVIKQIKFMMPSSTGTVVK